MLKTLGGDRLGAGNKMKVDLHGYERSSHDMSYIWRSTMSAGTIVPFMEEYALPGTTFDINLECDIKTHPTIGPLFGSYKVQLDVFVTPVRLYNSELHNNTLGIGRQMSTIKLPQIELTASTFDNEVIIGDLDNAQINPSSLLAHLGIRGIGWPVNETTTRQFNAVGIISYWDIVKNYYTNKQEEIGAVLHTPAVALITTIDEIEIDGETLPLFPLTGGIPVVPGTAMVILFTGATPILEQIMIYSTENGLKPATFYSTNWVEAVGTWGATYNRGTPATLEYWRYIDVTDLNNGRPAVATFPLENIDKMRREILKADGTVPFIINTTPVVDLIPYVWLAEQPNGKPNVLSSQEGLALKTYQSDLFNNWLKTENIEAISAQTAISTIGDQFTVDQFIISRKVWAMLQRIEVSGGTYDDWQDAVYVHEKYRNCESPMYMGGLIKELVFQEVVSNSESDAGQPLGTLAGKGVMSRKNKGGHVVIHIDEPSVIMALISLTPRIDYSQGNKWHIHLKTMDDFHKPALDQIGFQEDIVEQRAWWTTTANVSDEWQQLSAGKQPAWINYMTNVNVCRGNFAIKDNEMFMTLNRRYEPDPTLNDPQILDLTTYIDPSKFNFIFAETQLDAQNFWAQIGVDITARRKMSAKQMPNL